MNPRLEKTVLSLWALAVVVAVYYVAASGTARSPLAALLLVLTVAVVILALRRPAAMPIGGPQIAVLVVGGVVGALVVAGLVIGFIGPGTPAPPAGLTDPLDLGQRQLALDYAGKLKFDDRTHGAPDTQRLTLKDTLGNKRLGPLAIIVPEQQAHRNYKSALRRGRIVARMWVEAEYPPLSLPAGVSYVWVDSLDGDSARGVIIPDNATDSARRRPRPVVRLYTPWLTFAQARWVDDPGCVSCDMTGWCSLR